MLETTIIASVIALIGGAVAYYGWGNHKLLSIIGGAIGIIAAAVAIIGAFIGALAVIFKLIPVLILAGLILLLWRIFGNRDRAADAGSDTASTSYR